jgi:RNA polymerase sigma factor (sigma-70 family)
MFEVPPSIQTHTEAAVQGDSTALGIVFQFYRPRLQAHALRICGNTPLAQDAVQDTFISALLHLKSLRNTAVFYPWLKRILINRCYQLLKKENTVGFDENMERKDFLVVQTAEDKFEKLANLQMLYKALNYLSDELKSCVLLRYFGDYNSYEDIATILAVPVGTVRSRLSAAREKLSQEFIKMNDAGDSALLEAKEWSEFYSHSWENIYDNAEVRQELFDHFIPQLALRYTSGKAGIGRELLTEEIDNDLHFGSRYKPDVIVSSGNLTLIQGPNINHPQFPDRCAPASAIVLFRSKDKVTTAHVFDAPRP